MPCQDLTPQELRRLAQIGAQNPDLKDILEKAAPGLRQGMWMVAQQQGLVGPNDRLPPSNVGGPESRMPMPNTPTDFQPEYDQPHGGPHPLSPHGQSTGEQVSQPGGPQIGAPNAPEPPPQGQQQQRRNPLANMRA